MLIKKGIPVSPGVVITKAVVMDAADYPVRKRAVPASQVAEEHKRLTRALDASSRDIEQLRVKAAQKLGPELANIFASHISFLKDKKLIEQFRRMIDLERATAEYAVDAVMRDVAQEFSKLDSPIFRDRAQDIRDLARHLLKHLIGEQKAALDHLKTEAAVFAHDLTPSQTASFDREKIKAIATDAGGQTSHTAILAHALGIPAIVGLEHLVSEVNTGDTVIIDGNTGTVIVDPDAPTLLEYRQLQERQTVTESDLDAMAHLPAVTKDRAAITLWANIEFPSEIQASLAKGATGIGLYRTEFLYLASDTEPSEEQQCEAYRESIKALRGKTLTIRTLDLGADKLVPAGSEENGRESNPFLGCRSIRMCLQNLPLFRTQLRAILRASADGPVRIMFPMISNIMELRQAKMILSDVMEDLEEEGVEFHRKIPVGMMIEVPSAALQADAFGHEVDFFSIGTNDLIQYTVAVDRGNERIASLYSAAHPALAMLIRTVVRAAVKTKTDVSICGEMAGIPLYVPFLLGMGLRNLSITPPAIPEVKRIIRSVTIAQCQRIARKASTFDTDREVINYLQDQLQRILPEVYSGRSIEA